MKTKSKSQKDQARDLKKMETIVTARLREIGDNLPWNFEDVSQQVSYFMQLFYNEILRAYKARTNRYEQAQFDRLTNLFTDLCLQAEKGILQAENGKDTHVQ